MSETTDLRRDASLHLAGTGDVLVVDDNARNLAAIEAALGGLSDRLVTAQSGDEALQHLVARDFALILLGVQAPGMGGFETARLIRSGARTRHPPMIFITALGTDQAEVLEAYKLGAVDFIFEPIVPEVLRAKASLFVALEQRRAEVARQAALLREHERSAHERRLAEERRRSNEELARTVAERERAEGFLSVANERLAEADRRRDKMLAMLGHEIRNPLAPLVTGLEILRQVEGADPDVRRVYEVMDRKIRQLCRLVDDVLDVSRASGEITLQTQRLDLREVVRHAASACGEQFERREQSLELNVPDAPIPVQGDEARLTQIACNLLSNASRYSDRGGRVQISCGLDGDGALLRVADDGRGIRREWLEQIFDMFAQEHPGGGLGLGLTLAQRLAELHGGGVRADSPGEGLGSTLTVTLPALEAEAQVGSARRRVRRAERP